MKTIVISSAPFIPIGEDLYAYSPYVVELEIWARYSDEIGLACCLWESDRGLLISKVPFEVSKMFELREFNVKSFGNLLKAIRYSFRNFYVLYKAMRWADHIHFRCPGNIALMGCLVQILFPKKLKTAKYAGNWDPNAKQPLSYRIQKWLLNNTFLTRKMTVLVYGKWENTSKNIKPFFTASYRETDKIPVSPRPLEGKIKFIFAGTLANGKRPLYVIQMIGKLRESGFDVEADIYGDGSEKQMLLDYVAEKNLGNFIHFKGNQNQEILKSAFRESHFTMLPSRSEGWPKVVAEAMFWGSLPVVSEVSCVPYMLDGGNRGVLLDVDLEKDADKIIHLLERPEEYKAKVAESIAWSRQFTLDLFEKEIYQLLHP